MSRTFTKLFSSITESTVWCEPYPTRILWVSMLAMADRKGEVFASVPGLARRAGITLEECEIALKTFGQPDRYSRTPDHEGRRIENIDGGWRLLNYLKYREMRDEEAKREADAERQRRLREAQRDAALGESHAVTPPDECHGEGVTKRDSHGLSREVAQAEAEADNSNTPLTPRRRGDVPAGKADTRPDGFAEFWLAYPRKASKPHAQAAWRKLRLDTQALPAILAGLERDRRSDQWRRDNGQYIPHPATWLNGRRWEDEAAERAPQEGQPPRGFYDAPTYSAEDVLRAQGLPS
ncbi:hypothetical protein [Solimonas terrae]|uniref:Uncharacterized protein n=1 Tax=Solimonas terrae TaxID=1396819 RepID=A0A6M2BLY3_9GAMM|nr:hypothetical protein [Solimonas terrae]NGY03448.1 hypothetical protein [Solimonas terrae]